MSGFRVLFRKELLESWRTFRLPVVAGLFLVVGLSSPILAKYLPEIVRAAAGEQFPDIPMPTPVTADAIDQLLKNLSQFGSLAAILLAMGAVATEQERGTAAFILSKPVTRGAFLAAKLVALGLVLALATLLAAAGGWLYTAILFEPLPLVGWAWLTVLTWLGLFAYAALTFMASALTGSAIAAAGLGFAAFLVLSIAATVPDIGRLTPAGLGRPATALANAAASPGSLGWDLLAPVVATVVVVAMALGVANRAFRRREL
jgi:ABC-2 type transport system permease protein